MQLTPELLEAVVAGLFPPEARSEVAAVLSSYGVQPHEREPVRVRVAALKLSGGNLERLREVIGLAQRDYRDVIAWAEYPAEIRSPVGGLSTGDQRRIRAGDRDQYLAWLRSLEVRGP